MSAVEERLRVEPDGTVVALSGKMEYGQGIREAFARIVAEELAVPVDRVRVVLGDTASVPWDMGTFGSLSVEMEGLELRRAAAFARAELASRASARLGCPVDELECEGGALRRRAGGRALGFAELVAGAPITGAVPEDVTLAPPAPALPATPPGPARRDVVTGRAAFVADVRLPDMLHGCVLHPDVYGARLRALDATAAEAMPGVVAIVRDGDFAGVVAERRGQALAALRALRPSWDPPRDAAPATTDVTLRADPGVDAAFAGAAKRLRARFFTPHVANAPIGPSAGIADVRPDQALVHATTQRPFALREQVAQIADLPVHAVRVQPKAMSGGYGRHSAGDAALEAARLSKAVGRPVLVQWGRADELCAGPNRPEVLVEVQAAVDAAGTLVGWRSDEWTQPHTYGGVAPPQILAMTSGRNAVPPYALGAAEVLLHIATAKVRTGALRSLAAAPNVFAIESFVDELAHDAGEDPIAFRLRHTADPRLVRVLETVRERSGWAHAPRGGGLGIGVACAVYRSTYVAEVVEVSVAASGDVRLERVFCAVDPGHVVDPDNARSQVEGAVQMAASWTLLEELPHDGGRITASTWEDYPIATFRDAPREIDIAFMGDDATPSSGMGEPASVPTAAAIANAVFAACGARVRRLPLRADAVRRAAQGG